MDCNIDLDKVAKATVMKDDGSAAICIGEAVMDDAWGDWVGGVGRRGGGGGGEEKEEEIEGVGGRG